MPKVTGFPKFSFLLPKYSSNRAILAGQTLKNFTNNEQLQ
jgi:hypothetical protein